MRVPVIIVQFKCSIIKKGSRKFRQHLPPSHWSHPLHWSSPPPEWSAREPETSPFLSFSSFSYLHFSHWLEAMISLSAFPWLIRHLHRVGRVFLLTVGGMKKFSILCKYSFSAFNIASRSAIFCITICSFWCSSFIHVSVTLKHTSMSARERGEGDWMATFVLFLRFFLNHDNWNFIGNDRIDRTKWLDSGIWVNAIGITA